jgi:hypothetical protein
MNNKPQFTTFAIYKRTFTNVIKDGENIIECLGKINDHQLDSKLGYQQLGRFSC